MSRQSHNSGRVLTLQNLKDDILNCDDSHCKEEWDNSSSFIHSKFSWNMFIISDITSFSILFSDCPRILQHLQHYKRWNVWRTSNMSRNGSTNTLEVDKNWTVHVIIIIENKSVCLIINTLGFYFFNIMWYKAYSACRLEYRYMLRYLFLRYLYLSVKKRLMIGFILSNFVQE